MTVKAILLRVNSGRFLFHSPCVTMKTLEAFPDSLEKLHEAEEIRTRDSFPIRNFVFPFYSASFARPSSRNKVPR